MPGASVVWMSSKTKRMNTKPLESFHPELTLLT